MCNCCRWQVIKQLPHGMKQIVIVRRKVTSSLIRIIITASFAGQVTGVSFEVAFICQHLKFCLHMYRQRNSLNKPKIENNPFLQFILTLQSAIQKHILFTVYLHFMYHSIFLCSSDVLPNTGITDAVINHCFSFYVVFGQTGTSPEFQTKQIHALEKCTGRVL